MEQFLTLTLLKLELASNTHNDKALLLGKAKNNQYKILKQLSDLKEYDPTNTNKINSKKEALINSEKLYYNRYIVIKAFENGVFPFKDGFQKKKKRESDMAHKALPEWVNVIKKIFDKIQNAKVIIYRLDHLVVLLILSNQKN